MIIQISLTTIGADADNFNLYSNATGSWVLFASGITRAQLLSPAYYEVSVDDATTQVKIESTGVCDNYIILDVITIPASTTTTTTTTVA